MVSAVDYVRENIRFIHNGFRQAADGLTDEQVHYVPEGQSHSIAWIVWHGARIEDVFVNQLFQARPTEFDSNGWAAKTGLPEKGIGTGQSTEEAAAVHIRDIGQFNNYRDAVYRQVDEFISGLSDDDLTSRTVQLRDKTEKLGESINLHMVTHLNGHRGEINLLRGMMGFEPVLVNQGG